MTDSEQKAPPVEEDFQQTLARLEAIASRLEDPDTPLEESVALYEEGVRLARLCADRLQAAELKIAELHSDTGGLDDNMPSD